MKESNNISLIIRDLANELNEVEKGKLADYTNDPSFLAEQESLQEAWDVSSNYGSDFDVDIDAAFENFATKFNIPVAADTSTNQPAKGSKTLFLLVAAAILFLAGLFTFNKLNVNSNTNFNNETKSIQQIALSNNLTATLTPNALVKASKDGFTQKNGKVMYDLAGSKSNTKTGSQSIGTSLNADGSSNEDSKAIVISTDNLNIAANNAAAFSVLNADNLDYETIALKSGSLNIKHGTKSYELTQGQILELNTTTNTIAIEENSAANGAFQWVDKTLSFNQTPIELVFDEMEVYFGIDIDIKGNIPTDCHFTAQNMKNPSIKDVLQTLHTSFNLGVTQTNYKNFEIRNITCK